MTPTKPRAELGLMPAVKRDPNLHLYVDGGVILKNPSALGGTWAFVLVEGDAFYRYASGLVTPDQIGLPTVTNNYTELLAAVSGLEVLPDRWPGTLWTDSEVTYLRVTGWRTAAMAGIPSSLRKRLYDQMLRQPGLGVQLVKGHPTPEELAAGQTAKGVPTSKWNVLCDKMCGNEAAVFLGPAKPQAPAGTGTFEREATSR